MTNGQHENIQIDEAIAVRLLKMLLYNKVINQPTYEKVIRIYKLKEAV